MGAEIKTSHEEIKALVWAGLHKMEAAINGIRSELEETSNKQWRGS
jgi:hypothetical protein